MFWQAGHGHCVRKASRLCALGRACGIPSGSVSQRFAIISRTATYQFLGSDLFVYHGFTDFFWKENGLKRPLRSISNLQDAERRPLGNQWPQDSLFQVFNREKTVHGIVAYPLGSYTCAHRRIFLSAWKKVYGKMPRRSMDQTIFQRGKIQDPFLVSAVFKFLHTADIHLVCRCRSLNVMKRAGEALGKPPQGTGKSGRTCRCRTVAFVLSGG
jgi:hypothetical protein